VTPKGILPKAFPRKNPYYRQYTFTFIQNKKAPILLPRLCDPQGDSADWHSQGRTPITAIIFFIHSYKIKKPRYCYRGFVTPRGFCRRHSQGRTPITANILSHSYKIKKPRYCYRGFVTPRGFEPLLPP
jgi:hypothetical protein